MDKKITVLSDKGKECLDMLELLRCYGAEEDFLKAALIEYWFPGSVDGSFSGVTGFCSKRDGKE